MRKIVTLILSILAAAGCAWSQVKFINNFQQPASTTELASFSKGDYSYIDIEALAKLLGINTYRDDDKRKIVLYLGETRLKFTADNHFAVTEQKIYHLPVEVQLRDNIYYAPVEPFIRLFGGFFPGNLAYDRQTLFYNPPRSNILSLAASYDGDIGLFDIITDREPPYTYSASPGGRLTLFFPQSRIDSGNFPTVAPPEGIDSLFIEQTGDEVSLIFCLEAGIKVDSVYALNEISGIRIAASGFASRNAEIVNHTLEKYRDDWRFDTIVIDPGHGGDDPGAIGKSNLREKEVTLDIALRLEKLLRERMKVKTVLTRRKDVFIPLAERGKTANQAGGKLFISIHCNACKNHRANGIETYFLKPARNQNALDAAMRENASIKYEKDQSIYYELTDENYILLAMAQTNYARESETFAGVIQDEFGQRTSLKNRGVDQAGFYVLYGANMPAVLIELGFISNKNEERLLRTKQFRQKAAEIIFESVKAFCEAKEKEL